MKQWILLLATSLAAALLAGCQNTDEVTPAAPAEGVLSNVPSLSELAGTPAPEVQPLPTLDATQIAEGRELYAIHCASCHGSELEGEADWQTQNDDGTFRAPPHDASGHTWHHGDRLLLETIRLGGARLADDIGGTSEMPAFESVLDEQQMVAILAYIKSTWPEDIRLVQWEQTSSAP
jgi:mono/diheme cytochrome c family protein